MIHESACDDFNGMLSNSKKCYIKNCIRKMILSRHFFYPFGTLFPAVAFILEKNRDAIEKLTFQSTPLLFSQFITKLRI